MDFPVSCQLFLRLTRSGLGEYGAYRVSASGVSALTMQQEIEDCPVLGGGNEAPALLDFINAARLEFPTTAKALIEWRHKNNDFELPTWFNEVVTTSERAKALAVIEATLNQAAVSTSNAERELARLKKLKRRNQNENIRWVSMRNDLSHLEAEAEALRAVMQLIETSAQRDDSRGPTPRNPPTPKKVGRHDALSSELDAVLIREPNLVPSEILKRLQENAGKEGSCIVSVTKDEVTWKSTSGQLNTTDREALGKRLKRRAEKLTNPDDKTIGR